MKGKGPFRKTDLYSVQVRARKICFSMHVMVAEVSQFGTFVPNWIELKRKQKL